MTLYKTLVRPTLEYCSPVWKPYTKKDIYQIEKVQKRYTKMINGCKGKNYEERLTKLGVTSLEDRQYRSDMIQVYKILNDKLNIFPSNFIEKSNRISRGNSLKLYKKRGNRDLCKYSFTFRVTDQWNKLPEDVVLAPDVNVFKGRLDHLMRCAKGQ